MLTRQLVLGLAYWTPLITLLVSSLGLIALKRISGLSPWAKRLAAPPFYFVSLPMATLTVGMEFLLLVVHLFTAGEVGSPSNRFLGSLGTLLLMFEIFPIESFVFTVLGNVLLVALVFSGLMPGQVFLDENEWKSPAKEKRRRLEAIGLLAAFVWAWVSARYVIVQWETPLV